MSWEELPGLRIEACTKLGGGFLPAVVGLSFFDGPLHWSPPVCSLPLVIDKGALAQTSDRIQISAIMANVDTYYRINAKAPLSDSLIARIERIRRLSKEARTYAQKAKLGEQVVAQVSTNLSQVSVSGK